MDIHELTKHHLANLHGRVATILINRGHRRWSEKMWKIFKIFTQRIKLGDILKERCDCIDDESKKKSGIEYVLPPEIEKNQLVGGEFEILPLIGGEFKILRQFRILRQNYIFTT